MGVLLKREKRDRKKNAGFGSAHSSWRAPPEIRRENKEIRRENKRVCRDAEFQP
uniref:hypothetical protein n=1 Tax=Citrobacter freundii TaxID=546 RepID=UPI00155D96D1|nr:hypothetical protein [Citrobacter freundii]